MLFSEFLLSKDTNESMVIRVRHHTSNIDRMKTARARRKASFKLKQKLFAKIRKRKHCPLGQVPDNDGSGCHKPKHLIGLKKRD